jgi:hypothetical protein
MGSDLNPGLLEESDGDFNRHQEGLESRQSGR